MSISRRTFLKSTAAGGLVMATAGLPRFAIGGQAKLKIGVMMPFSGTYAALGEAGTNGLKMALAERDNKLGGREVELVMLDDESHAGRAPANATKLIKNDGVDVLFGTVHSGVAMGMVKVARETGTTLVIPNAGLAAATGRCARPTSSAPRSPCGRPAIPWARSPMTRAIATSLR